MSAAATILIPAHNQFAYCRDCVASIQRNTRAPYKLVVVDNGSTDGVADYFDSLDGVTVLHAPRNLGFAGGVNLGWPEAEGHLIVLNSDTLVPPGWLGRLVAALESAPRWGMLGPRTNNAAGPQCIEGLELDSEEAVAALSNALWEQHGAAVEPLHRVVGFCMVIRDGVWQQVGPFDERFGIGNYEDDDYGTRVRRAGFELGMASGCFVFHHGGKTFAGLGLTGTHYDDLMRENRQRYMDKWNVFLPEPGQAAKRDAAAHAAQAREALSAGRTAEALQHWKQAIAAQPQASENYLGMADTLEAAGQAALAEKFRAQAEGLGRS
ncbi:MAG: glycosyltransferase [Candidatus Hydrogenedens sp.]|nr:glycosyltransferase [Candidatus Hydrogenedens sp.]